MNCSPRRANRRSSKLAGVIDDDGRVLLEPWVSSASSGLPVAAQLPLVATPFLGRTSERGAVISLVCDADVRVVTLTGFAGAGKTRLAIEAGAAEVIRACSSKHRTAAGVSDTNGQEVDTTRVWNVVAVQECWLRSVSIRFTAWWASGISRISA
ncbi:MAG: hypothetical protein WKF58_16135 [Ilumatobacteraceae bacterium]